MTLFNDEIWNIVKSYFIDYKLIFIKEKLDEYEYLGKLSEGYINCFCGRFIPFKKYHKHLQSRSHLVCKSNVLKNKINIDDVNIITFYFE